MARRKSTRRATRVIPISLGDQCLGRNNWKPSGEYFFHKANFLSQVAANVSNDNFQIGPYFFPPRLNGQLYADFIENQLPILLEDVPLDVRAELIFQHDGAPAHFQRQVRNRLNIQFPERWMGRGGPIIWPPRSPDLNVLDYFVWGHIKSLVEHLRDGTEEEVCEGIVAAFDTITPDMANRATRNIIQRAEICIQEGGRHFEQLL